MSASLDALVSATNTLQTTIQAAIDKINNPPSTVCPATDADLADLTSRLTDMNTNLQNALNPPAPAPAPTPTAMVDTTASRRIDPRTGKPPK